MMAIRENGRYLIITLVLATIGCTRNDSETKPIDLPKDTDIQVRVYADRGVVLPSGKKGGAIQFYGMKVREDGSEISKWRIFIHEFHGTLFKRDYEEINELDNTTYLRVHTFGRMLDGPKQIYFHIDRTTGEILSKGFKGDREFEEIFKVKSFRRRLIVERPASKGDLRQTEEEIEEKLERDVFENEKDNNLR